MVEKLLCGVMGHAVNRRRVWHDGLEYRTRCKRCGGSLHRAESGWRRIDESEAGDPRRSDIRH